MTESLSLKSVAVIGAGELGGLVAHALARYDVVADVRLIDERGQAAAGKALDIAQAGAIEGFATRVTAGVDTSEAAGASVVVVADRFGGEEWQGEEGLTLLGRLSRSSRAVLVCAGASQRDLVERGARELRINRSRLIGSAPEAFAAAARAMVALEVNASPRDVALSALGIPPHRMIVVWEEATIGGFAATRMLGEPVRRRIDARLGALWPPGDYALAVAGAKTVELLTGRRRGLACCFVAPDDSAGTRTRASALPVQLGPDGLVRVVLPELNARDKTALENAMLL